MVTEIYFNQNFVVAKVRTNQNTNGKRKDEHILYPRHKCWGYNNVLVIQWPDINLTIYMQLMTDDHENNLRALYFYISSFIMRILVVKYNVRTETFKTHLFQFNAIILPFRSTHVVTHKIEKRHTKERSMMPDLNRYNVRIRT